jgi:hypothetical protein
MNISLPGFGIGRAIGTRRVGFHDPDRSVIVASLARLRPDVPVVSAAGAGCPSPVIDKLSSRSARLADVGSFALSPVRSVTAIGNDRLVVGLALSTEVLTACFAAV